MEEREKYKKMMREQLSKWTYKMNALKTSGEHAKGYIQSDCDREIDDLNRKIKAAELQLKKLNDMDDHKWNKCKTATEETMSEVKHSLDKLGQKLA